MEYKRIFKNPKTRTIILRLLGFIPDKTMLKLQYRIKFKRKLNLKEPKRFTEKLQWYKLYWRDPLMKKCVDKAEVRKYVSDCGFDEILVPLVGIYDCVEDVNFSMLPEKCVMKDTLGGGGRSVILCENIKRLNIEDTKKMMSEWIKKPVSYKIGGREWPYGGQKHRIIVEEYLPSKKENGGLIDYKFFCFYGEPKMLYVVADREVGEKASFGIFTAEFTKLNVVRRDEKPLKREMKKPEGYEKMLEIARKLSRPFPEVRVDLYYVEGHIYFGEMTFFSASGYMSFEPDKFDYELAEWFVLPEKKIE